MAFDGTTIAAVRKELSDSILGGRIYKIAQPEPDELLITIKHPKGNANYIFLQVHLFH